jgi:cystathionine beta-lyase/cystathionine gamma-synthase
LRTQSVHAGTTETGPVWPLSEPILASTVYAMHDPAIAAQRATADPPHPDYVRDGMPTVRALERAVAALEGAPEAQAVPSGMAAIALTLLAHLRGGSYRRCSGQLL